MTHKVIKNDCNKTQNNIKCNYKERYMKCPNCGNNVENANVCPYCNTTLNNLQNADSGVNTNISMSWNTANVNKNVDKRPKGCGIASIIMSAITIFFCLIVWYLISLTMTGNSNDMIGFVVLFISGGVIAYFLAVLCGFVSTLLAIIQIIKSRRALSIIALIIAIIVFVFAIVTVVLGTKGLGIFAPQQ